MMRGILAAVQRKAKVANKIENVHVSTEKSRVVANDDQNKDESKG
jgi:hypothetical protein